MLSSKDDWPDIDEENLHGSAAEAVRAWVATADYRAMAPDGSAVLFACDPLGESSGRRTVILVTEEEGPDRADFPLVDDVESIDWRGEVVRIGVRFSTENATRLGLEQLALVIEVPAEELEEFLGLAEFEPCEELSAAAALLASVGAGGERVLELAGEDEQRAGQENADYARARADYRELFDQAFEQSAPRWSLDEVRDARLRDCAVGVGLEDMVDELRRVARATLGITVSAKPASTKQGRSRSGRSPRGGRVGGEPDLPPGTPWPSSDGALLPFLLQLDLAAIPPIPGLPLPDAGVLSFFCGHNDDASQPGGAVLHSAGELTRAKLPARPKFADPVIGLLPEGELRFEAGVGIPRWGSSSYQSLSFVVEQEDRGGGGDPDGGEADDLSEAYSDIAAELTRGSSWLGGFPRNLDGDVIEELVLESHDLTVDESPLTVPRSVLERRAQSSADWAESLDRFDEWYPRRQQLATEYHEWLCLLSLDSHEDFGMNWWDAGHLVFLIHRADLEAGRFDAARPRIVSS